MQPVEGDIRCSAAIVGSANSQCADKAAIEQQAFNGGFVSCFIFIGMLLGEPTHLLVFPIREAILHGGGYDYFPGMWTALAPLITGLWGISIIVSEARKDKRAVNRARPGTDFSFKMR